MPAAGVADPPTQLSARPVRDGVMLGLAAGVAGVAFGAAAVSSGLSSVAGVRTQPARFHRARPSSRWSASSPAVAACSPGTTGRDPARQPERPLRPAAGRRAAAARARPAADRARRHRRDDCRHAGAARPGRGPQGFHRDILLPLPDLEPCHAGRRARRRADRIAAGLRARCGRAGRVPGADLASAEGRADRAAVALAGAAIALGTTPVLPVGVPVILAARRGGAEPGRSSPALPRAER